MAGKGEFLKAVDIAQARIESVASQVEIIGQLRLPVVGLRSECVLQDFRARSGFAGTGEVHAFAGIGQQREPVGAGLGAFLAGHGIEQAEQQQEQAETFKPHAGTADMAVHGGAAIGPPNRGKSHRQPESGGEQPGFACQIYGFHWGVGVVGAGYLPSPNRS